MKAYYQIKDPSFPLKAEISLEEYYDKLKEEGIKFNDIYKAFMLDVMDKGIENKDLQITKEKSLAKLIETVKQVPQFETSLRKFWLE
ncbi:hypothetical protein [Candidatus Borrarchaeum sp.]|uniref:hypothetical protein n=1 Tax=Candidatus Borrarchaeum sp. TaxID=2846742 RepID=UPI00257B76D1|nr:hypothetical protein [Candidatus Borrarchaeum sp.]